MQIKKNQQPKKKHHTSALCAGIFVSFCMSGSVLANTIHQQIHQQQQSITQQQQQQNTLEDALKTQEKALSDHLRTINALIQEQKTHQKHIQQLQQQQIKLKHQEAKQQQQLAALINLHYRHHTPPRTSMILLNDHQPEITARLNVYAQKIQQAQTNTLQTIKKTQLTQQQKQQQLEQEEQAYRQKVTTLKTEQTALLNAQRQRKNTLNNLQSQIKTQQQKITQLKQQEQERQQKIAVQQARLKAEAKKAQSQRQKQNATRPLFGLSKQKGKLPWPSSGSLRHDYNEPLEGELRWKGIVIKQKSGQNIKAIASGKVVFADWLRGYGLLLVLDHGHGDMSFYGYNQALLKKVGERVNANDPIAQAGNSGGQTNTGLYFEIRRKGVPVNPNLWLQS